MRSDQLTDAQLSALAAHVRPMMSWLAKLEKRMQEQAFPPSDPLVAKVRQAREALQGLHLRAPLFVVRRYRSARHEGMMAEANVHLRAIS